MVQPSTSSLAIAGIWVTFILNTVLNTPSDFQGFPIDLPMGMAVIIVVMPIVFFAFMSFFGPATSPFFLPPTLVTWIDARYGQHTFESFVVRLRPLLLFGLTGLLSGLIGLWQTYRNGGQYESYVFNGLWVSSGMAFVMTHVVLYARRAKGIYPSFLDQTARPAIPAIVKLPLGPALRTYWWTLIGITVLPAAMSIGQQFVPFELIIVLFFAVGFTAMWPSLSGRAPFTFWLVAMGLYLCGGIAATVLTPLLLK